jgi:hypothetical protein
MPETKNLIVKASCTKTEMGLRFSFLSRAVNIQVEIDLDEDPEYFHAMVSKLPEMVSLQMEEYVKEHPDE